MKYLSIDLETTGLDPNTCEVLMLSAIVEDTEEQVPLRDLPHFTCFIKNDTDSYVGESYALALNSWIFDILSGQEPTDYPVVVMSQAMTAFEDFCYDHFGNTRPTLAGKNVAGFDWQFLKDHTKLKIDHRIIDVGSVFFDSSRDTLPGLNTCMKMAGVEGEVTHDAYDDALDVIACLRTKY